MKRIVIAALGLLALNVALAAEPTPADKKWLTVVEKMVAEGHNKITTPSKDRVDLLKEWADKKGYSLQLSKNDKGFSAELTKKQLAQK